LQLGELFTIMPLIIMLYPDLDLELLYVRL
jgi:hypothetical protein